MAELNSSAATITNLRSKVPDFIVQQKALDVANPSQDETYYYFDEATKHYGYYLKMSEIFNAANALATWSTHRGFICEDPEMKAQLDHVRGMGRDSFIQIMWNQVVVKLIVGDAFTEVKRNDKGKILNMIPISPERVRLVFGKPSGLLKRYDVFNGTDWKPVSLDNMLHSSNKRIGDQMHGTSQLTASKFVIDALNEALEDERVIKHRDKALGIVYYQTDKSGKISYVNRQIEDGVKYGEMIGLPEGTAKIEPYPGRSSEDRSGWITLLQNKFYQDFGVPRSIASSDGTSEVGGKMGHVIFEPIYTKEQVDLENDLWNQQAIKVKFNRPPSLGGMQPQLDEAKNTGQQSIQPNDVSVTTERE